MVWSSATELNSIAKVKWIFKTNLVEIQQRFTYFRPTLDKLCMSRAVKIFSLVSMVSITIKFKTILGLLGYPYSCCFSSIFHLVLGTHFSVFWHNSLVGIFSVHVQFSCSVMSDFATPWIAASQASLSITNSQGLLKLMSIESVMPSDRLILCRPLILLPSIFPNIRLFSNKSVLHIRWPKDWSFSFNAFNEYSGLISFRMDWLDLLAVQGTLKSILQHHSSKASILLHSAFFIVQLSQPYMATGKTIALTRWTFVDKVMSLLLCCLGWS